MNPVYISLTGRGLGGAELIMVSVMSGRVCLTTALVLHITSVRQHVGQSDAMKEYK